MGISRTKDWSSARTENNMRTFILSLVVVAVSGDAKPWTVAQVAAGEPVKNAIAEGRLHNIGVITNAAQAGVTHVGAVPLSYNVPALLPHTFYGKREAEAEPYTLGQVAAGQTAGGVITAIDYGHNTGGLRPLVPHHAPVSPVYSYSAYHPYTYYGKREAEAEAEAKPYTLAQVAAGQTAGGVITSVGGHPVVPHYAPFRAVNTVLPNAAVYSAYQPYFSYGKREAEAEPYTLGQVAAGLTNGGVITSVGGLPVAPFRSVAVNSVLPHTGVYSAYHPYAAVNPYYG